LPLALLLWLRALCAPARAVDVAIDAKVELAALVEAEYG
jgi:hypothetical protein